MAYDPNAVAARERETWQRAADQYVDNIAPMTARSGQVPMLEELANIAGDSAILELGSGTGDVSDQLSAIGGRIVGVDFAPNMVEIASRRFPGIEFKVADAESVPYADGEFDVVVSCYTAHHFARPQRVFDEAHRVLKPGGRIAVIVPIQSEQKCFGAFFESAKEEIPPEDVPGGPLLNVEDPGEVGGVLRSVGFNEVFAEKRVKPIRLESLDLLLRSGWAVMGLDGYPQDVQERIRARTVERSAPFRCENGAYDFPDVVIVARGVK